MGLCFSCFYTQQDLKSVPFFTFDGYKTRGTVVYIYDGDTVHIVLPLKETKQMVKIKTRLDGIDTPELRVQEQKIKALAAKARLIEILKETYNVVQVECGKFDKYGRVLVTLYSSKYEKSINQMLIDEGHAYEYHGKTKQKFTQNIHLKDE